MKRLNILILIFIFPTSIASAEKYTIKILLDKTVAPKIEEIDYTFYSYTDPYKEIEKLLSIEKKDGNNFITITLKEDEYLLIRYKTTTKEVDYKDFYNFLRLCYDEKKDDIFLDRKKITQEDKYIPDLFLSIGLTLLVNKNLIYQTGVGNYNFQLNLNPHNILKRIRTFNKLNIKYLSRIQYSMEFTLISSFKYPYDYKGTLCIFDWLKISYALKNKIENVDGGILPFFGLSTIYYEKELGEWIHKTFWMGGICLMLNPGKFGMFVDLKYIFSHFDDTGPFSGGMFNSTIGVIFSVF